MKIVVALFSLLFLAVSNTQAQDNLLEARFPGCADKEDLDCSDMKMLQFIFSNLRHPDEAKSAGIAGEVVVKFSVTKEGAVTNASIVEGLGHGCDKEALRVMTLMPTWLPAEEAGVAVDSEVEIVIKFK